MNNFLGTEPVRNTGANDKLKLSSIVWYAIGMSTGRQFITALVSTYILIFFTDTFGIPAAAAGSIMFFATIWDAVNDPLIGTLADRTRMRWGQIPSLPCFDTYTHGSYFNPSFCGTFL
jgi:Na+/melibiose symporter-like transporter